MVNLAGGISRLKGLWDHEFLRLVSHSRLCFSIMG